MPERTTAGLVVWVVFSIAGGESILCPLTWVTSSIGPTRPLGYPRVAPTGGEPAGPSNSDPPPKEGLASGEGTVGTDTGPAGCVAMDPGSPVAKTLGLIGVVSETASVETVAATRATSSGSTSPGLWALDLV